ncbi:16S rRNA (uracil(1498)-N(3))-methyltransferase [Micrococcus sp.]|uniref:16S rRNA (uracil(1498)-N(3))-methyltransferase n=1 Tax=Micrococcus sp. TaxID=1271 RepID=UPI0026DBA83A|nr:16S rRNA (uracil(1498)-N(3))-methyltransferase [Micrococcus sp.]MDO4238668.1 16S rRNA (uracil(1498)-N(3))-methyltransferase [Micrococcus sp.]
MTAPLFLLDPGALDGVAPGAEVALTGTEARHAGASMRLVPGEEVLVADGTGARARGTVASAAADEVRVRIEELTPEPAPAPRLVLVQALSKGDRDLMAVQAATELGVDAVVPWEAERSIVRWRGAKADRAHRKWEDTVRAAAKQARRGRVPEVRAAVSGTRVAELARTRADDGGARLVLVLHEDAEQGLSAVPAAELAAVSEVLLVVGPEGGVSEAELAAAVDAGARPVLLGPHVLRASTAGPAALAVLQHRLGRW